MIGSLATRATIHAVADDVHARHSIGHALLDGLKESALVGTKRVCHGGGQQEHDLLLLLQDAVHDVCNAKVIDGNVGILIPVRIVLHDLVAHRVPLVYKHFAAKALEERRHELDLRKIEIYGRVSHGNARYVRQGIYMVTSYGTSVPKDVCEAMFRVYLDGNLRGLPGKSEYSIQ